MSRNRKKAIKHAKARAKSRARAQAKRVAVAAAAGCDIVEIRFKSLVISRVFERFLAAEGAYLSFQDLGTEEPSNVYKAYSERGVILRAGKDDQEVRDIFPAMATAMQEKKTNKEPA